MRIQPGRTIRIPTAVMDRYGLAEGDEVELFPRSKCGAKPRRRKVDFAKFRGAFAQTRLAERTDDYLREIRGQ